MSSVTIPIKSSEVQDILNNSPTPDILEISYDYNLPIFPFFCYNPVECRKLEKLRIKEKRNSIPIINPFFL